MAKRVKANLEFLLVKVEVKGIHEIGVVSRWSRPRVREAY